MGTFVLIGCSTLKQTWFLDTPSRTALLHCLCPASTSSRAPLGNECPCYNQEKGGDERHN